MVAVVFKCIVYIIILTSKFSQVCSIHMRVFEGFVKACVLHSSLSSVLYMIVCTTYESHLLQISIYSVGLEDTEIQLFSILYA